MKPALQQFNGLSTAKVPRTRVVVVQPHEFPPYSRHRRNHQPAFKPEGTFIVDAVIFQVILLGTGVVLKVTFVITTTAVVQAVPLRTSATPKNSLDPEATADIPSL